MNSANRSRASVSCRVLGFSPQAFYAWKRSPIGERDLVDAYATNAAITVHADDPGFGYRFIADELAAAGHAVSERRVWKICSQARIVSLLTPAKVSAPRG